MKTDQTSWMGMFETENALYFWPYGLSYCQFTKALTAEFPKWNIQDDMYYFTLVNNRLISEESSVVAQW